MRRFRTALGEEFSVRREIPRLTWKPRLRGRTAGVDDVLLTAPSGGTGVPVLDAFGLVFAAIWVVLLLLLVIPLLVFVAELTLVVAVVVPIAAVAVAVGVARHSVVLTRLADQRVVDTRGARGFVGSWRAARELRAAALDGAYVAADDPRRAETIRARTPWSG